MNILFLAPQPFFVERGTPIAVRAVVEALAADGHRVDLLTYHGGEDIELPSEVRVLRIARPPMVRHVPIGPSWQKAVCDVSLLRSAWRCAGGAEGGGDGGLAAYDVVHAVEEAVFIALLLKRRFGLPFIYDMDSLMSEQVAEKSRTMRPLAAAFARGERRAVREALGVLAVCPALAEAAHRLHPAGNVALLPDIPLNHAPPGPPLDPSMVDELGAIPGIKLLYVGNLEAYQGVDLMLRAFALVAPRHPDATLVIVGGDQRAAAELASLAPDLCAAGRVRFLGARPLSKLGSLLAGADILISPRRAGRNTPMKIYSYLESGRPIIASRLPTHTQVLTDAVAMLADPAPEPLAAAMRSLITSPALRRRLGDAGREFVRREFSPAVFRGRLREFYDGVARTLPGPQTRRAPRRPEIVPTTL